MAEIRATEYFCPTCPDTLLVYAERRQTIHDVYIPATKKMVTVIFEICYCRTCEGSMWMQREVAPESAP
jgi:hypothetical protein